jgi:four helix bundle protein
LREQQVEAERDRERQREAEEKQRKAEKEAVFFCFFCLKSDFFCLLGGDMYRSFKEMPVWQLAMKIAERVHQFTEVLPKKEDFGFTSQVRRSASSIPANIAEAFGRKHTLEKVNFYSIAMGSLTETQSHLEYGRRVGYVWDDLAAELEGNLVALEGELKKIILSLKRSKLRFSSKS